MKLNSLLVGKTTLLDEVLQSAIVKKPVAGKQKLTFIGLEGDEQANKRHHGGVDKAVHHYSFDHYEYWREDIGDAAVLRAAGAFGENFSTYGQNEMTIAVGDVFRIGSALVEVSQGRQPCATLNIYFGIADMARRMQLTGRTGWYYRVLEEGFVAAGDEISLVERRSPEWTLARLHHYFYEDTLNREALEEIAALPPLSQGWRALAQKRLHDNAVEDWSKRLDGK